MVADSGFMTFMLIIILTVPIHPKSAPVRDLTKLLNGGKPPPGGPAPPRRYPNDWDDVSREIELIIVGTDYPLTGRGTLRLAGNYLLNISNRPDIRWAEVNTE